VTKKMKRDRTPTPVNDGVAEAMEVRLAYKNLIDSFDEDQKTLEHRVNEQTAQDQDSDDDHGSHGHHGHHGSHGNDGNSTP
jgi:hypothetical protein